MIEWFSYEDRLTLYGNTQKERTVNRERKRLVKKAPASLSHKEVLIGDIDGKEDGIPFPMLITSTQQRYAKTINLLPGDDFNVGSIVYWNKSRWLITQKDVEDEINKKGGMELCNKLISWQNPETLEIHQRWVTTDKPYFNNLEDLRSLEVSQREFKIQVSDDDETSLLDIGKRFMLEVIGDKPKTYRVTSVDSMTERYSIGDTIKGFRILNIEQDQFNPTTDNIELMLCDYVPTKSIPPPPDDIHIEFQYVGDPEIKQGISRGKEFVAVVYASDGTPVFGAISDLTVSMIPTLEPYVKATIDGNKVNLIANNKAELGSVIRITATYQDIDPVYIDIVVVSMF